MADGDTGAGGTGAGGTGAGGTGAGGTAGRVLVVDDEETIRVLCRVNLELAGHEVIEAADGAGALEMARQHAPDIIFLDVMMPRMDGWDVLRRLKDDPATAAIPVVMLTARSSDADQRRAQDEGATEYVVKPFHPSTLEDHVAQALARREGPGGA